MIPPTPAATSTPWTVVQEEARAMIASGNRADGMAHLRAHAQTPPTDIELSGIFNIAAVHGAYNEAVDLAEAYAGQRNDRRLHQKFCNIWCLDLLRKAERYELFFDLLEHFDGEQINLPLFYVHLATALHDETFMRAVREPNVPSRNVL